MFGHTSKVMTSDMAKKFNYGVSSKVDITCEDCALGKLGKKSMGKTTGRK